MFDGKQQFAVRCDKANAFKDTELAARIREQCMQNPDGEPWRSIRHYIGRLAAWNRAARTVVCFAKQHPEYLAGASVKAVPTPRLPPSISVSTQAGQTNKKLEDTLAELYATHNCLVSRGLLSKASGLPLDMLDKRFAVIVAKSPKEYRLHPELTMAEHFLKRKLAFVDDDRYIGCSKPSCYGCKMFLQVHPLKLAVRPCHNRVWIKWCYPNMPEDTTSEEAEEWAERRSQFISSIVDEIRETCTSSSWRPGKARDSTTGMSGSFRSLHMTSYDSTFTAESER